MKKLIGITVVILFLLVGFVGLHLNADGPNIKISANGKECIITTTKKFDLLIFEDGHSDDPMMIVAAEKQGLRYRVRMTIDGRRLILIREIDQDRSIDLPDLGISYRFFGNAESRRLHKGGRYMLVQGRHIFFEITERS